jgi:hypothetical protein
MILSIRKVHLHIQVIIDLIHHTAVFIIAYSSYHKSGIIVVPEDFFERTIVFFMLSGFDGNQTSVLDSPINRGQHTAFIHVNGAHAQLDIMMFHDEFLGNLDEYFLTGFGLRLIDLPFRLDTSGPNIFSAIFISSTVTGQFLMTFIRSNDLNFSIVGVPTIWYNFLSSLAHSNWHNIYPFRFSVTVLIKLLVQILCDSVLLLQI